MVSRNTVKHEAVTYLCAMVAEFDLELDYMDVKNSFLYSELEETNMMKQSKGFEFRGKEELVCNLYKALYGFKQSSRQ